MLKITETSVVDDKNVQTDEFEYNIQEVENVDSCYCEFCLDKFWSISDLERHKKEIHGSLAKHLLMSNLKQIEYQVVSDKMKLVVKLALLKEKENKAKNSCQCKYFCSIFHSNHNRKKSKSEEFLLRMEESQVRLLSV